MSLSRSQQSAASVGGGVAARGTKEQQREKKRSKAGAGPSVLSDPGANVSSTTDTLLSPLSHSSSPAPSSPGPGASFPPSSSSSSSPETLLIAEAEDYIVHLLRCFAQGMCWASRFEGEKSVEAYLGLPGEQLRTWRAMVGVAEGWMERLEYEKVRFPPFVSAFLLRA